MITKIKIWDIDGCLVDSSHRRRNLPDSNTIDLDHWRENQHLRHNDRITRLHKFYKAHLDCKRTYVIVCSARVWSIDEVIWINSFLGEPDKLLLRPIEDNVTEDHVLKRRQLLQLLRLKQFAHLPVTMYEDCSRNLEALADVLSKAILIRNHGYD